MVAVFESGVVQTISESRNLETAKQSWEGNLTVLLLFVDNLAVISGFEREMGWIGI